MVRFNLIKKLILMLILIFMTSSSLQIPAISVTQPASSKAEQFEYEAQALYELGLFDADKFSSNLTREEAIAILAKAMKWNVDANGRSEFTDVSNIYQPYVNEAVKHGIITVNGSKQLNAKGIVTGKEIVAWLLMILGVKQQDAVNNTAESASSLSLNIIADGTVYNRDLMAKAIYETILTKPINDHYTILDKIINDNKNLLPIAEKYNLLSIDSILKSKVNIDDVVWDGKQYVGIEDNYFSGKVRISPDARNWEERDISNRGLYYFDIDFIKGNYIISSTQFYEHALEKTGIFKKGPDSYATIDISLSSDLNDWSRISGEDQSSYSGEGCAIPIRLNDKYVIISEKETFVSDDGKNYITKANQLKFDTSKYGYLFQILTVPLTISNGDIYGLCYKVFNGYLYLYANGEYNNGGHNMFGTYYDDDFTYDMIMRTKNGYEWEMSYYAKKDFLTNTSGPEMFIDKDQLTCIMGDKIISSKDGVSWKDSYAELKPFISISYDTSDSLSYETYKNTQKKKFLSVRNFAAPKVYYYNGYYYIIPNELTLSSKENSFHNNYSLMQKGLYITKDLKNFVNLNLKGHILRFIQADRNNLFTDQMVIDTNKAESYLNSPEAIYTEYLKGISEMESLSELKDLSGLISELKTKPLTENELNYLMWKLFGVNEGYITIWDQDTVKELKGLVFYPDFGAISFVKDKSGLYDFKELHMYNRTKKDDLAYGLFIGGILTDDIISRLNLNEDIKSTVYAADIDNVFLIHIGVEENSSGQMAVKDINILNKEYLK